MTEEPTPSEFPDDALAYVILGCFRAAAEFEQFPIKIDHVEDNLDDEGIIRSFTLVTASGLRFVTTVSHVVEVES